jgi:hypothetical protein
MLLEAQSFHFTSRLPSQQFRPTRSPDAQFGLRISDRRPYYEEKRTDRCAVGRSRYEHGADDRHHHPGD